MPCDAKQVADLVNLGFRGEVSRTGWTTEADYLIGKRTDSTEVGNLIADPSAAILLCQRDQEMVGSVYLQRQGDTAHLGMLVVQPQLQGQGVGKRIMEAAEAFVQREWHAKSIEMTVITLRHELIAYYERRGYRRTGVFKPFPIEDQRSTALVGNLEFEVLEKQL
jgi:ribosomal protein S18 acetylase RimI-like enzyme